jgi:hypothetical protein
LARAPEHVCRVGVNPDGPTSDGSPTTKEVGMLRPVAAAVAFAALSLPALAQSPSPSGSASTPGQVTVPSGQNSGAGIAGQPGNKNGPAQSSPGTTGAGASSGQTPSNNSVREQDSAKIPGLPGNKSGPPAKAPSDSNGK